ncbi:hypothetical protein P9112_009167 [Eukaryota sp. TZLM1-RC]
MITSPTASQLRLTDHNIREYCEIPPEVDSFHITSLALNHEMGRPKIQSIGNSLVHFSNLLSLDLSRNVISSLSGLEPCTKLQHLNLYYNKISSLDEISKLRKNTRLQSLDLRLNPICRLIPNYRIEVLLRIPWLSSLDSRTVEEDERRELNLDPIPSPDSLSASTDKEVEGQQDEQDLNQSFSSPEPSPRLSPVASSVQECTESLLLLFDKIGLGIAKGKQSALKNALVELLEPVVKTSFDEGVRSVREGSSMVAYKEDNDEERKMLKESHQALIASNAELLSEIKSLRQREEELTAAWEEKFNELREQFSEIVP